MPGASSFLKHQRGLALPDDSVDVRRIAWSPDSRSLAVSVGSRLIVWDVASHNQVATADGVGSFAWTPEGRRLACVTDGGRSISLLNLASGQMSVLRSGERDQQFLRVVWGTGRPKLAFSFQSRAEIGGGVLSASGSVLWEWSAPNEDLRSEPWHGALTWMHAGKLIGFVTGRDVAVHDPDDGNRLSRLWHGARSVVDLAAAPNGRTLAATSTDRSIYVWPSVSPGESEQAAYVLEGHRSPVRSCSFHPDGSLLASIDDDSRILFWTTSTWTVVADHTVSNSGAVAYDSNRGRLATPGGRRWDAVSLWRHGQVAAPRQTAHHYVNATVLLVGDSGVGKSGLGLRLTGNAFEPTESTHGRHIWLLDAVEIARENGDRETREVFLWDLAGQPGYRVVHQLHLSRADVALVVFDARSEVDAFAGVEYWTRAFDQAHALGRSAGEPARRVLVAARVDRGVIAASRDRIEAELIRGGFDHYLATSAKTGEGIDPLRAAIDELVRWEALPRVASNALFADVKRFIVEEKSAGRLLATSQDLVIGFRRAREGVLERTAGTDAGDVLQLFDACVGRLETQALVRRLSFGGLVLLQPELLDSYAAAVLNAARAEPDGFGSLAEAAVRALAHPPGSETIGESDHGLLLLATIEELVRAELAIREETESGPQLVFPSELTRDHPEAPELPEASVLYRFEGAPSTAYATLVVRLSRSGLFSLTDMWRTAVQLRSLGGSVCGLALAGVEGSAELGLFFSPDAGEETRRSLDEYVDLHLRRRALPDSVERIERFICRNCGEALSDQQVKRRRERGLDHASCPVCDQRIALIGRRERTEPVVSSAVAEMDRSAERGRTELVNAKVVEAKGVAGEYDVFLCHNAEDKPAVRELADTLLAHGLRPWLDEREIRPGQRWQKELERVIGSVNSAAVLTGRSGIGPWQDEEIEALLDDFKRRDAHVIPVLLPTATEARDVPLFLRNRSWVDFRVSDPDPVEQLIWGITGQRRERAM